MLTTFEIPQTTLQDPILAPVKQGVYPRDKLPIINKLSILRHPLQIRILMINSGHTGWPCNLSLRGRVNSLTTAVFLPILIAWMKTWTEGFEFFRLWRWLPPGCRNVRHCQQQQCYSGLRSPGRLYSTYLWNASWVQTFQNRMILKYQQFLHGCVISLQVLDITHRFVALARWTSKELF